MIKKVLIACIAVFLLMSVAHAADNVTTTDTTDDVGTQNDTVKTVEVTKKASKISVKKVSGKEKTKVKIKATVKDSDGKAIKNTNVAFKIKGKTYNAKTNKNGQATITYKLPKAKYLKTVTTKKGNIVTKKKMYQTTYNVKITVKGTDDYNSSVATSKVISKKSPVVKKYRYKKIFKTVVVPFKKGDHSYKRGPVTIQVIYQKDYGNDDLWIAADKTKSLERLKISTKLFSKHKNGKWKWDKKWQHTMSEHDVIVSYYGKLPKTSLIKVKYEMPTYTLIK